MHEDILIHLAYKPNDLERMFNVKIKIVWIFIIVFTTMTMYSCIIQKKLDDIQSKEFTSDIGMAAVKEGTIICYRDGSNLMCKNGTNDPVTIVKNIEGQFMISNQCVYYFHNSDLHKVDINSKEDVLMVRKIDSSFIGAYKNSIYLYYRSPTRDAIIMVTENKSKELYKMENIHFATILKGQLFIIADDLNENKSYSYLSEDNQIIYKTDLDTKEKQLKKITNCKLPQLLYTEYVQNSVLSDDNAIYCLNMVDSWNHSYVKEVEIMRIDKTGTVESLIKKDEPIGLSFLIDGTIVYYCLREQIYEQAGQEFLNLRNEKDGKGAEKILCHEKKYYWYESDVDDNFGIIYCYDGQEVFPCIETTSFILDIAIIDETLYYCVDLNPEWSEEIGYFVDL